MNENEYTDSDGVRYVAKPHPNCFGCVAEHRVNVCLMLPYCNGEIRKDETSVIWVKAEKVPA